MIYHYLYISRPTKDFYLEDMIQLLEKARTNNVNLGLSGLLVYKNNYFLQWLEGEKENVELIYKNIIKDDRHTDPVILDKGHLEKRIFPEWTMGFSHLSFVQKMGLDGLNKSFVPDQWPPENYNSKQPGLSVLTRFIYHDEMEF